MSDNSEEDLIKPRIPSKSPESEYLAGLETLAHYKILRLLGKGGMGEVYLGYEENLRRYVAIKTLPEFLRQHPDLVERFFREAQAVAALKHPNIISVYYFGEEKGKYFFAMEYVEGIDMSDLIEQKGAVNIRDALKIMLQCADALKYASEHKVIHRDVKPSNILLDKEGNVHIADFGVAKQVNLDTTITEKGGLLGSPFYMSPEQARGEKVDFRADMYSLGCTFYYLLEGKPPFDANIITQVMLKHLNDPLPELSQYRNFQGGKLGAILKKMTEKKPDDRYKSYDDLIKELKEIEFNLIQGVQTSIITPIPSLTSNAPVTPSPERQKTIVMPVEKVKAKSKLPKRIGVLVVLLLLCGIVYNYWDQIMLTSSNLLSSLPSSSDTTSRAVAPAKDNVNVQNNTPPANNTPANNSSLNNQPPPPPDNQDADQSPPDSNPPGQPKQSITLNFIKDLKQIASSQLPDVQDSIKNYDYIEGMRLLRGQRLKTDNRIPGPTIFGFMRWCFNLQDLKHTLIDSMNSKSGKTFMLNGKSYSIIRANDEEILAKNPNQQENTIGWEAIPPDQYFTMINTFLPHNMKNDALSLLFQATYGLPQFDQNKKSYEDTYHSSYDSYSFPNPQRPTQRRDGPNGQNP